MKTMELGEAPLESCVADAQDDQVVLTREGKPVALLNLIAERRRQPTISRSELEQCLDGANAANDPKAPA